MKKKVAYLSLGLVVLVLLIGSILPGIVERRFNPVLSEAVKQPASAEAEQLHQQLMVVDLHNDALLWRRDLTREARRGHVDFPRMAGGNAGLQVFTTVTQVPYQQNYDSNSLATGDKIRTLAIAQGWPPSTWNSPLQRALYQGRKLERFRQQFDHPVRLIQNQQDLAQLMKDRQAAADTSLPLGVMLGIEGAQALEGRLENLDVLAQAGFRLFGLQHFFDNALGGSQHGVDKGGLTEFGKAVVKRLNQQSLIIDVAHSSQQTVRDVLAISDRPVVVSHTGVYGACQSARNWPDELMQAIARKGGLIGIGFWAGAVCDPSPEGIARAVRYAVDLLGIDQVALGSDFNGAVATTFDVAGLSLVTSALVKEGFTDAQIAKIMGLNALDFFSRQLPP